MVPYRNPRHQHVASVLRSGG
ncbi:transcriptional regulator [Rhodobacter sphaeroides]|uniref:Transcriptional regulatory protein PufK n=2 Tax=Cereibacter sphaeroides TaxID=1063 RepID=PUFK_CERS4|nr:RecName: Full=Transcriptional regulatory protein PufK [Cereibacter sphaeroides 2.4.1]AAB46798.1 pufB transcriptional regulator [Cereibacter sphaeroides]ACM01445.1 Transcriptional regulatory protein PufK [Cereibacter sphaeroides KD131]RAZ84068.1 transcriptional regulator [Cereibacter johrii]RDS94680.1 transcriptional regulator [Cereibacter sphaeroides f. sp. denitrificans]AAF24301.1 PufK [Cereibacter sphaeroides]